MKLKLLLLIVLITIQVLPQDLQKNIAITIDDLPVVTSINNEANFKYIANNIIDKCKRQSVPVIGFLNESNFVKNGKYNTTLRSLMEKWLDRGLLLGNHTYAHKSLNKITFAEFKEDVEMGEKTLNEILSARNLKLQYFRHPYLHTGTSLSLRDSTVQYLQGRGYKIAAVTIDNSDWLIAKAYERVWIKQDRELLNKISADYVDYLRRCILYYQDQSIKLLGRNMNHILLLHANRLNADNIDKIFLMLKEINYNIISLDKALDDEAYINMKDEFTGNAGISWLHRWAVTAGKTKEFYAGEPEVPEYIRKLAE